LAGRKSTADIKEPSAYLPISIYKLTSALQFTRGAKREIRDDNGKLFFSERQMSISIPGEYTKEELGTVIEQLEKQGHKRIKAKELSIDVPSKCPSCKKNGTPSIQPWQPTWKKPPIKKLVYGHSSKPKTCLIGQVEFVGGMRIKLKKGLPRDSLGFRRRAGTYDFTSKMKDF